jgi:hypothetical protein
MKARRRALLGAAALSAAGVLAAAPLGAWGVVLFLMAVALLLVLAVLWISRQEATLRGRDVGGTCTTYAKVQGAGSFLLTLGNNGLDIRGSSRKTRRLPPERYSWDDIADLKIEGVGPYGSAGRLTVRLPNRVLQAEIGRVDEMTAIWHDRQEQRD